MTLDKYFARIGYDGPARADVETLVGVHRAHLDAIAYENLDVFLRKPVTRDHRDAFEKIVSMRRGGWCYEMNGLLSWALEEIGFRVTPLAGAVRRDTRGDEAIGNHLVLRVDLDRPWIADAGFGDGLIEPIPLGQGEYHQRGFVFRLEKLDARWWRFHNHAHGSAPSFDFVDEPADDALMESQSRMLQADGSRFVDNLVCQRYRPYGIAALRGREFRKVTPAGVELHALTSQTDFARVLAEEFDLAGVEAALLWARTQAPA